MKRKKKCFYCFVFPVCGGLQSGEGGVITSPDYPNSYPNNSRCSWILEAPEGMTISVSETDLSVSKSLYLASQLPAFPSFC